MEQYRNGLQRYHQRCHKRKRHGLGTRKTCAAAVVLLAAAPAWASPSTRLTYERGTGAEACPDERALRRAVEQRLGYDPFFPWASRTIVARIRAEARRLHASVNLLDEAGLVRGSRELSAPLAQCTELVSGMALAISIAIDPASVDRTPGAPSTPRADPDDAAVDWTAARAAEKESQPRAPERAASGAPSGTAAKAPPGRAWHVEVGAGLTGTADPAWLAPTSIGVGPALDVALRRTAWSVGVEGRYAIGLARHYGPATVSSSLAEGALLGCHHPGAALVCVEASVGRLGIAGAGLARPGSDAIAVVRLGARVGWDFPLSKVLSLRPHADAAFNLGTQSVEVDARTVWSAKIFGAFFGIALRGRFP